MTNKNEADEIRAFINSYRGKELFSTGAELVDYTGDLYNVMGSTEDPRSVNGHKGVAWMKLLAKYEDFSGASCYVTSPLSKRASSHPRFAVGGHMTPNSSGIVDSGGVTYLMPLCKWHNSTARNGSSFSHIETKMLRLTGFMKGDTAITFALRLGNNKEDNLLFFDRSSNKWDSRNLSDSESNGMVSESLMSTFTDINRQDFAIFERIGDYFFIS